MKLYYFTLFVLMNTAGLNATIEFPGKAEFLSNLKTDNDRQGAQRFIEVWEEIVNNSAKAYKAENCWDANNPTSNRCEIMKRLIELHATKIAGCFTLPEAKCNTDSFITPLNRSELNTLVTGEPLRDYRRISDEKTVENFIKFNQALRDDANWQPTQDELDKMKQKAKSY